MPVKDRNFPISTLLEGIKSLVIGKNEFEKKELFQKNLEFVEFSLYQDSNGSTEI